MKYLFLRSSDIFVNLWESRFQCNANLTSNLQFSVFLFSGTFVSSCLWWRSHHFLCSLLWKFNLFHLTFLVYLSKRLHAPFFCTCLALHWLLLSKSSWNSPWHALVCSVVPNNCQLALCYLVDVQCNMTVLFSFIRK